ncbi:MAG: hypothetical protein ACYDDR_14195, partial [Acidithiobacillus ferrivorans]
RSCRLRFTSPFFSPYYSFFHQARFNVSLRETRFSSRLRAAPFCPLPLPGQPAVFGQVLAYPIAFVGLCVYALPWR